MALVSPPLTSSTSFPSGFSSQDNLENAGPGRIRNKRSSSTFNADLTPVISSSSGNTIGSSKPGMNRSSSTPSFLEDHSRSQSYSGSTSPLFNATTSTSNRIPSPSTHSSSKSLSSLGPPSRSTSSNDLRSSSPNSSIHSQTQQYNQQQPFTFQSSQPFNSSPTLVPFQLSQQFQQHPHPQFPFIPSPHPNSNQPLYSSSSSSNSPGLYSPGFTSGNEQQLQLMIQQQHQAMLLQQAQYQQQQWQIEMMRNQQQQQQGNYNWQQQQQQQQQSQVPRRRATSGPAPAQNQNQNQNQFSSPPPLPYPSPSSSLSHQYSNPTIRTPLSNLPTQLSSSPVSMNGSHFGHPYPTPPGSFESGSRDNQRSSSARGAEVIGEGYHPYRRGNSQPASSDRNSSRTTVSSPSPAPSQNPSFRSVSSSSAMSSYPSSSSNTSTSTTPTSHKRGDSTSSLSKMNFPPLPSINTPSKSINAASSSIYPQLNTRSSSSSVRTGESTRLTPPTTPTQLNHSRNSSKNSSISSLSSVNSKVERSPALASSTQGRSSSPVLPSTTVSVPIVPASIAATVAKKPSPLSQSVGSRAGASTPTSAARPSTPSTTREAREEDEDSDDTAAPHHSNVVLTPRPKEKKGLGYQLKKAFGSSNSISQLAVDGKGPTIYPSSSGQSKSSSRPPRVRNDSASSTESNTPYTPPSHNNPLPSLSANASTTSVNTTSNTTTNSKGHTLGKRFGILNSKHNSSTDNISISSTVSSASVMIRKLGQMGKLARRNSLMGLTKAFKKKESVVEGDEGSSVKGGDKKGSVAIANVSHVTAEVEGGNSATSGISPAAALARKHQLQYAEQEAAKAALIPPVRSFAVHARTNSNASSDQASIKSNKSSGIGGGFGRSKSTDDIKLLEKQEKLKNGTAKKSRWGLGSFSSKTNLSELASGTSNLGDDQATPRASVEGSKSTSAVATRYPGFGSYGDDDVGEELESPSPPFGEDEYEPSLRDAPISNHRRDPKPVRGILKGAGTYNQEDYAMPSPRGLFSRSRVNSFDSPHQIARPGSPGNAALVGRIPSGAQLDGLEPPTTSPRTDTRSSSTLDSNSNSPYLNPSLNASAPVLKSATSIQLLRSTSSTPSGGKKISFAPNLSVHSTWPANVYDRKAAEATCNKLTPAIAQRIKEELNSYKREEMEVHPTSRQLTHFFV